MTRNIDNSPLKIDAPPIDHLQEEDDSPTKWMVEVIGGPVSAESLQAMALEYLDKPTEEPERLLPSHNIENERLTELCSVRIE